MNPSLFKAITDQITPDVAYFAPEIALSVTACLVLLLDLMLRQRDSRHLAWVALTGVVAAAALLATLSPFGEARALFRAHAGDGAMTPTGMIVFDGFGNLVKFMLLFGTAAAIVLTYAHRPMRGVRTGEFYSVLLIAVVGMFTMATASDMLMVFLGIEMVSIPSFILVCYSKGNRPSAEAALKYAIYGSVASGMMVYGLSLLYGLTGTTQLTGIARVALEVEHGLSLVFGFTLFLVLAGFAYKMSVVPFHFWTPDVYEGAPTPVTAFLATASKTAGFAVFVRFVHALGGTPGLTDIDWRNLVAVLSAVTMTVGNLGALLQTDVKRMMAYSSIAHAGYLLMGCVALSGEGAYGFEAIGFYLLSYLFMNYGAFACVVAIESRTGRTDIHAYNGLYRTSPVLAFAMTVFLVALIGLPPTAGFIGKFFVFAVVIKSKLYWLALLAAINTGISVGYYLRLVKNMYLVEPAADAPASGDEGGLLRALIVANLAATLILGVFFGGALELVGKMKLTPRPPAKIADAPKGGTR